jgi:hypothetical protein
MKTHLNMILGLTVLYATLFCGLMISANGRRTDARRFAFKRGLVKLLKRNGI